MGAVSTVYESARDRFRRSDSGMRALMVGLDSAGKTTILYKVTGGKGVETTIPTIGFNVETADLGGKHFSLVTVWDMGGRCPLRPLWRHYYQKLSEDGHKGALIFVLDSADCLPRSRYGGRGEQAKDELWRLLREKDLEGLPLLVFANKQDLKEAATVQEITDLLKLHCVHAREWYVQPCVAVTGEGLYEGFEWVEAACRRQAGPSAQPGVEEALPPPHLGYDPTDCPVLDRFQPLQRATACPFAKAAKLWAAPLPCGDCGWARRAGLALGHFVKRSERNLPLDGFVLELGPDAKGDVHAFGKAVRDALLDLTDLDPLGEQVMRKGYVGRAGWHVRFGGATLFATAFGPCYPDTSPRFAHGAGAFLLLQPERSFLRHGLGPVHVGRQSPPSRRDAVRDAFAHAGRPFFVPEKPAQFPQASLIVRPLREDGENLAWWAPDGSLSRTVEEGKADRDADAESVTTAATREP